MSDEESNLPVTFEEGSKAELIYKMRMQGLSLTDIAQELHTSKQAVDSVMKTRLGYEASMMDDDERRTLIALENARYDYYLRKLWPSIEYGDLKAIEAALKISDRRMKINQLEAPSSTQTTQVLVVGGESSSYIDTLKEMVDDG